MERTRWNSAGGIKLDVTRRREEEEEEGRKEKNRKKRDDLLLCSDGRLSDIYYKRNFQPNLTDLKFLGRFLRFAQEFFLSQNLWYRLQIIKAFKLLVDH